MILHHRKAIFITLPIVAIVVVVAILFFRWKSSEFSSIAGIVSTKVDKVAVRTDWGKSTTITSKQEISEIISTLDGCNYKKVSSQPPFSGYIYNMSFYSGAKVEATFLLVGEPIINDSTYTIIGSLDTNKLEKIVGLYPPS